MLFHLQLHEAILMPAGYISNFLVFKVTDIVAPLVVKIINTSLSTGTVPNFYKQAVISLI